MTLQDVDAALRQTEAGIKQAMTTNGKSKALVPIYKRGPELDMSIFEREIGRILNKMRTTGRRDEDTEQAMLRAIETYEAATR